MAVMMEVPYAIDRADHIIVRDGAGHYIQFPQLTTTQQGNLSAVNGMMLYNSTTTRLEAYENGAWGVPGSGGGAFVKTDGSVPLTSDWDVGAHGIRAATLTADGLTSGRVVFAGANGLLSDDADLFWDNTNKRLGIGTAGPAVPLDIRGSTGEYLLSLGESHTALSTGTVISMASSGNLPFEIIVASDTDSHRPILNWFRGKGSIGSYTAVTNDFYLGSIQAKGYDGTGWIDSSGIHMMVDGAVSAGIVPGKILFKVRDSVGNLNTSMIIKQSGRIGMGLVVPLAQCHIDQASTTGAIPVLVLDQADESDGFINFIGTSAASAVGPISTWTAGNSIQGFRRIEINGAQFWAPFYDAPTS